MLANVGRFWFGYGGKNWGFSSVWFGFLTSTKTGMDVQWWWGGRVPARWQTSARRANFVSGQVRERCWERSEDQTDSGTQPGRLGNMH